MNIYGFLSKLIEKGVSFDIKKVLLSSYTNSKACVKLNDHYTDYIAIKSGLKQGGLLSPIFYNLYAVADPRGGRGVAGCIPPPAFFL